MAEVELAEVVADLLWQAGAAGVEEQDVDGGTRLIGGFEQRTDAAGACVTAERMGLVAEVLEVDDDGLDAWRAWAAPERAGRFWVTPPWVDAPSTGPGEEVLWIDPGRTFGSGSHPTTRLVLALLDELVAPGASVLDVGCGSGVLAVGAARCGAGSVVATDIDPGAPAATVANAERNGVAGSITATDRPLADLAADGRTYDVVLGNLLAPVIVELGAALVACTAPDGVLVVSGLLEDRWEATMPALAPLVPVAVVADDGWVAVRLTRGGGR